MLRHEPWSGFDIVLLADSALEHTVGKAAV
jgi:hypothetical protein